MLHSAAHGLTQMVLRTDIAGMPLEWIDYREAARLYHQEQIAYTCGSLVYSLYGGQTRHRLAALRVSNGGATVWNPSANATIDALALSSTMLYVGGNFSSIGGQPEWSHLARFLPLPKPKIGTLKPARGRVGATVTITGSGLGASRGASRVFFGGKAVTRYVSWSATRIKFRVPALAKGRKSVTVRTLGGKSNAKAFKVI